MNRRDYLGALGALGTWAANAQTRDAPVLVGFLRAGVRTSDEIVRSFQDEFARLGWQRDVNVRFEFRDGELNHQQLERAARELVALKPALLITNSSESTVALKRLTNKIPIIVSAATNPVRLGLAKSLRRPGANVTGLLTMGDVIGPKLYELARAVSPQAGRIAYVFNLANPTSTPSGWAPLARRVQAASVPLPVKKASDLEPALRSLQPPRDHVLIVQSDTLLSVYFGRMAALAKALKMPSVSLSLNWARSGGLLSYGPPGAESRKRVAEMADKVLRGTPVGDIPFEQPTLIQLVLNRRTAREIGITLSKDLLSRADEVIE